MSNLIGYFGVMSSGKTVSAMPHLVDQDKKVLSNIPLNIVNYEYLRNLDFLEWYIEMIQIKDRKEKTEFVREKFYNTIWFIDEIGSIVPSRKRTLSSEIFTDFITMVGKLNCDVVYTSQLYESQVDKIYRSLTPHLVDCTRCNINGEVVFSGRRKLPYPILIMQDVTLKTKPIRKWSQIFFPDRYYKYYDTEELLFVNKIKLKEIEKRLK